MVLKELIFQFLLWDGVLVSQELIFNSFYFGRCGGLEKKGVVVLKKTEF